MFRVTSAGPACVLPAGSLLTAAHDSYDADAVSLIWESVDSLISGWYAEMLKSKDVACVHCLAARTYDPFLFSLNDLELTVAMGKQYAYCRGIHPVRIGSCSVGVHPGWVAHAAPDVLASEVALADIDDLRIEFNSIQLDPNMLGEGSFAKVYKGVHSGETVAVKRINFEGMEGTRFATSCRFVTAGS